MKRKHFILALVAMLLSAFSSNAQVTTETALKEALTTGGEVTLGADINVAAQIEIPTGKTVVLDLAGYDIIGGWNGSSTTNHIYALSNRGTLTIKDSGTEGKIVSRGIYNYGTLTLESGIIDACDGNGGYAVNNESGSTFIMNGGVVSANYDDGDAPGAGNYDATALDVPAGCTATLNGGKITSVTNFTFAISLAGELIVPETSTVEVTGAHGAISMSAGSADIDGGTFICSGVQGQTDNVVYVTGGSMDISGGTFEHTGNLVNADSGAAVVMSGANGVLTISGGEFTGLNGSVSGNANTTLTGGSYGSVLGYDSWDNIKQYVPEGETVTIEGESYTNVATAVGVAQVGENVFTTVLEALQYAIDNNAAELKILCDVREKMTIDFDLKINADLTITADAPVKVEFYNDGTSYDFAVGSTNNNTLTIGENVHFDLVDRVIWLGYWGNNVTVVVNGYLGGYQIWHGANTVVKGTLDSHGEAFVMRRNATLTANEGAKVNANYFQIYSGHIVAENATITAGLVWVNNNHNYGNEGTVSFELDNTEFTSNGEVKIYAGEGKIVSVTLENSSLFDAKGVVTLGDNVKVVADATSSIQDANGSVVIPVAKIGEQGYASLEEAVKAVKEGETITILAGTIEEGTIKLPATLKNVAFKGEEGAILKDMTISAADGNAYSYVGLTFDGITFDNSRILLTGWRNGDETIKNLAVTNCTFKNLNDDTNTAPIHINKDASEPVNGFTFTNNVIDGATGGSKSGIYAQVTGEVKVENNIINNVSFRPYVIQVTTDDGIADNFTVKGNTFSGSAVGRAQGLGNNAEGTDNVNLVVSNNIFKGITEAQQICYWNFNPETTTADLSKNYYDIDIVANPSKIYFNSSAADNYALRDMNVFPIYTALNENGTINTESAFTPKFYIAKVGENSYETLSEAVAAAQAGDEIVLTADVKTTDGVVITDKNLTIDLNGKTYTVTEGANTNNRNFKINGTSVVTVKNGTMVAAGEYSSGAYGTIRTEGTANVTLTGLKLYNYRGNGLNIKACAGTTVTIENTEIYANYGGGIESAGGTIVVNNGVTVKQEGMYTAPYNSMAISVNGGGKVTVNGGTFSTECITAEEANNQGTSHGPWVAGVLNSGGTLIINGGTFSNDNFGENSLATAARGAILADTKAKVEINGGTFNVLKNVIDIQNNLGDTNNNPSVLLVGGTYSADPRISAQYGSNLITLAEDYIAVENNGVWTVEKAAAKIGDVEYTSLQNALNAAAAGTGNVTVSILADVDLTGIDWNPVTVSAPGYPVVTVEGNDKTITGLNDMLFAGTWAGGSGLIIKNLTIANSAIVNDKDDANGTVGVGAFIGFPQASATITLENCHLKNSSVEGGHWTGGLIGYAAGYAGNDGPVFMNLTIKDCSVTESTITGKGSVGGVIGHGSGNGWTNVVIEETTVSNNTITSTGSSNVKAGAVMGTIGAAGQPTTVNGVTKTGGMSVSATVADNTVKSNGTEITTIYGRQGTATGMLAVAGGSYDNYPIEEGVAYAAPAAGYKIEQNTDGTYGVVVDPAYGKVAKIGDVYYETLAKAITAAKANDVITFLKDITEDVTISNSVTIDGADKEYTGTMTGNAGLNVTVQNVKFVNGGFVKSAKSSTGNYTSKNCTFDGAGTYAYPLSFNGANTINVENCTVKDYLYSFLYVRSSTANVNVKDVTVENCPSYAVYFSPGVTTATFENLTVKNSNNGFVINNTAKRAFTIKDCKMENVTTAINHANGTLDITCTALGVNNFGGAALSQYAKLIGATITGTNYYGSVKGMVEKAETDQTVQLLSDITLDATGYEMASCDGYPSFVHVEGKAITVDLNGKKITADVDAADVSNFVIGVFSTDNGGELTLVDSSTEGTGTVKLDAEEGKVYSLLCNYEDGCKMTINGGTYVANKVRDCLVYSGGKTDALVTVNGGNFTLGNVGVGENGKPWIFNVLGAGDHHVLVKGGTFNADINRQHWSNEVYVAKECYTVANTDGTYTVKEGAVAYVNEGMLTGPYFVRKNIGYATLAEAVAEVDNDETVTMLKDVTLEETVTITADKKNITLDLAGKTISMNDASSKGTYAIKNNGSLTIKDAGENGKITFKSTTPDNSFGYATSTIGNAGKLTVESGTIENTTVGGASYAIDGIWHTDTVSLTINGGTIIANKIAVRQVPFSATAKNVVTVNGGILNGATAGLQLHNTSNDAMLAEVNINGGEFFGDYGFYTSFSSASASSKAVINITDGTFHGYPYIYNGKNGSDATPMTVSVTGGYFDNMPYIYTKDANGNAVNIPAIAGGTYGYDVTDYCADDFRCVQNADGRYTVERYVFEIVDGELTEFHNDKDIENVTITYKRTFDNVGKWQALYVPFDIPVEKLLNAGYSVAYFNDIHNYDVDGDGVNDSNFDMELRKIKSGTIKANYPYFIRPDESSALNMNLELNNVLLKKTKETTVECTSVFEKYEVIGFYDTKTIVHGDGSFALTKSGEWSQAKTSARIAPFRLILKMTTFGGEPVDVSESANIRIRVEGEFDDATGIDGVSNSDESDNIYYDLTGRPVRTPEKGKIYIFNGKKILY